ncbi:MAG: DUF364 domain-containing protein [Thermodesulfobacteriota bacterium]|nr:DUF364 domain-containing protein [Thermodesulfobacteriota bacterium]
MIKTGDISRHIHEHLYNSSKKLYVEEARIGLGYIGVLLEGDRPGLSALLRNELSPGCGTFSKAGTLAGSDASELLDLLVNGRNPLEKALGLATANAMICPDIAEEPEKDSIALMNLSPTDRVAMVGHFGPLVERIKKTGAKLHIIEKDPNRMEILDRKEIDSILEKCSVAIITATSILNNTIEEILNGLGNPRHVTIMGPSTPMFGEAFAQTPVTHLGGSAVLDPRKIMQIISEGGGTPDMRPFLRFIDRRIEHIKRTEET